MNLQPPRRLKGNEDATADVTREIINRDTRGARSVIAYPPSTRGEIDGREDGNDDLPVVIDNDALAHERVRACMTRHRGG